MKEKAKKSVKNKKTKGEPEAKRKIKAVYRVEKDRADRMSKLLDSSMDLVEKAAAKLTSYEERVDQLKARVVDLEGILRLEGHV